MKDKNKDLVLNFYNNETSDEQIIPSGKPIKRNIKTNSVSIGKERDIKNLSKGQTKQESQ